MNEMPIIRIELDRLKHSVQAHLVDLNEELSEHISKSLTSKLNETWVIQEIDKAVDQCLKNAIADIGNNWKLQDFLTKAIVSNLTKEGEQ